MILSLAFACSPSETAAAGDDSDPVDNGTDDSGDTGTAIEILVSPIEGTVLGQRISLSTGGGFGLSCNGTNGDFFPLRQSEGGVLTLVGLAAETGYSCSLAVDTTGMVESLAFVTGALPASVPSLEGGDFTLEDGARAPDYVLLVFGRTGGLVSFDDQLVVVDRDGTVRWYYDYGGVDPDLAVEAIPLPEGVLFAGGAKFAPTLLGWDLTLLEQVDSTESFTHDVLQSGEELWALISVENAQGSNTFPGFGVVAFEGWDSEPAWTWSSQTLVDQGYLPPVAPEAIAPPWHANGITLAGDDLVLVSVKETNEIYAIRRSDGEVAWVLDGQDGQAIFAQQHAPSVVGDSLFLFDNGWKGQPSRALELLLDVETGAASIAWQWTGTASDGTAWSEPLLGDVEVLGNGDRMVTLGHCAYSYCTTGNEADRSTVVQVSPSGQPGWKLTFTEADASIYRSAAVEDGCSVFGNERYCSE
jgi:hypothetical protein